MVIGGALGMHDALLSMDDTLDALGKRSVYNGLGASAGAVIGSASYKIKELYNKIRR
jgi:hypothetical protein